MRRCSKRWLDADCPAGVLAIFDHPNTVDRYTVFYTDNEHGWASYVAMNAAPFHPQGFGQHGGMPVHDVVKYRYANKHRYAKWSSLPDQCKKLVRQDLTIQ